MKFQKVADEEDHFHRLPEDLLLSIICRLGDLKSLFQCSLISKLFASVIPQTRIVSVGLPSTGNFTHESCKKMFAALERLCCAHTVEDIRELRIPSFQKLKLLTYLEKFTNLEAICLEYGDPSNMKSSFPKWKVKCSNNCKIEKLVYLYPSVVWKLGENLSAEQLKLHEISNDKKTYANCLWEMLGRYFEWLCLTRFLVKTHASLKMVTIRDANGRGKLIFKGEQIVKLRLCLSPEEYLEQITHFKLKSGDIPYVHLSLSRYIMVRVFITIMDIPMEPSASARHNDVYDEIMSLDFDDDDEKILGEAVKLILKSHMQRIKDVKL